MNDISARYNMKFAVCEWRRTRLRIMFTATSSTTLAPSGQGDPERGKGCVVVEGADVTCY